MVLEPQQDEKGICTEGGGGVLGSDSDGKLVTYKVLIKQQNTL